MMKAGWTISVLRDGEMMSSTAFTKIKIKDGTVYSGHRICASSGYRVRVRRETCASQKTQITKRCVLP